MSEFRCIGYFGPYCPVDAPFAESQNMRLVPAKDYAHSDQFPLELAMKIFWEADTINMTASVQTTIAEGSVTGTCNRTIDWGYYREALQPNPLRTKVNTAAEMLCYISDDCKLENSKPYPTHTLFTDTVNQGIIPWTDPFLQQEWYTAEVMFIYPRANYNPEQKTRPITLYAPFGFSLSNIINLNQSTGGAQISVYNPTRPISPLGLPSQIVGQADIITPWGSCKVDMEGPLTTTAASMTITVTAADPAVRYGKPKV